MAENVADKALDATFPPFSVASSAESVADCLQDATLLPFRGRRFRYLSQSEGCAGENCRDLLQTSALMSQIVLNLLQSVPILSRLRLLCCRIVAI